MRTRPRSTPDPNASSSITMRVQLDSDPGGIGRITTAVGEAAGTVTAVDVVESHHDRVDAVSDHCAGVLGWMFLLLWNTFSGSYLAFTSASRRYVSSP
jgi:hypothetical protein